MNEKKKRYRKTPWRGRISRRIILKYLLVLAIFLVLSYLVLIMLNEISYIGIEEELLFCGVVLVSGRWSRYVFLQDRCVIWMK